MERGNEEDTVASQCLEGGFKQSNVAEHFKSSAITFTTISKYHSKPYQGKVLRLNPKERKRHARIHTFTLTLTGTYAMILF